MHIWGLKISHLCTHLYEVKTLLLEVKDITVHYHKVTAVRNISITVEDGKIVTLIGSNGAGKTTTLRAVSGLEHPTTGEIHFKGRRIDKLPSHKINALGIAMVPEGRRVFPQMTVLENLLVGAFLRKNKDDIQKTLEEVVFKHFPRLKERKNQTAGTLSGGEQQMLAMGRALMSAPKLLLLDEPSLGLSPIMCGEIAAIIRDIHAEGRTVILVEQNARLALAIAQHAYVIETGDIVLSGPAEELRKNDKVKKAYLGG
jgi:branched-chain amino acid transport system ATP-binding protein